MIIHSFWPKKHKWVLYWALFDHQHLWIVKHKGSFFVPGSFYLLWLPKFNHFQTLSNGKLELNIDFLLCGPILSFKIAWSSLDFCNFDQQYFSEVLYLTKLWFLKQKPPNHRKNGKWNQWNNSSSMLKMIQQLTWADQTIAKEFEISQALGKKTSLPILTFCKFHSNP